MPFAPPRRSSRPPRGPIATRRPCSPDSAGCRSCSAGWTPTSSSPPPSGDGSDQPRRYGDSKAAGSRPNCPGCCPSRPRPSPRASPPTSDGSPSYLPDRVVLILGQDDLFPYRIEYRRAVDKKGGPSADDEGRLLVSIDLDEVTTQRPHRPHAIRLQSGQRRARGSDRRLPAIAGREAVKRQKAERRQGRKADRRLRGTLAVSQLARLATCPYRTAVAEGGPRGGANRRRGSHKSTAG